MLCATQILILDNYPFTSAPSPFPSYIIDFILTLCSYFVVGTIVVVKPKAWPSMLPALLILRIISQQKIVTLFVFLKSLSNSS
jgi:hypothetical protein